MTIDKNVFLAVVLVMIISLLQGCGGKLRTPPWTDNELKQMQHEEQEVVPLVKYEF